MVRSAHFVGAAIALASCGQPQGPATPSGSASPNAGAETPPDAQPGRDEVIEAQWRESVGSNAPGPRADATAVWTGRDVIVWGGDSSYPSEDTGYAPVDPQPQDSGGLYDPVADRWATMSTKGAPNARTHHSAVWTGKEMIVWGGGWADKTGERFTALDNGGAFDPATDTWRALSTKKGPMPRGMHSAVWTGTEMIVWGGRGGGGVYATGGRYDPSADSWRAVSTTGAPAPRRFHVAVWTGTEMIVWGGADNHQPLGDGARYDPAKDTWAPLPTAGAPSPREGAVAVWTGTEMIVWGGRSGDTRYTDGARFDPATSTWKPMATVSYKATAPVAVWTGREMAISGESEANDGEGIAASLASYDPATDRWRRFAAGTPFHGHAMVWTSSSVVVAGGDDGTNLNPFTVVVPWPVRSR